MYEAIFFEVDKHINVSKQQASLEVIDS